MIPHRMLTSEIYGNGLRDRVTACRRRLRVNRAAQRSQVNNDTEELFPETAMPTSVVRMNGGAPFAGAETRDSETLLVSEQEVGIT